MTPKSQRVLVNLIVNQEKNKRKRSKRLKGKVILIRTSENNSIIPNLTNKFSIPQKMKKKQNQEREKHII